MEEIAPICGIPPQKTLTMEKKEEKKVETVNDDKVETT